MSPKVEIDHFENLTADFCMHRQAQFILRGLRNASDFDYEKTISQLNQIIGKGLETVFLISQPAYSHISSTIVREIIKGVAMPVHSYQTRLKLSIIIQNNETYTHSHNYSSYTHRSIFACRSQNTGKKISGSACRQRQDQYPRLGAGCRYL